MVTPFAFTRRERPSFIRARSAARVLLLAGAIAGVRACMPLAAQASPAGPRTLHAALAAEEHAPAIRGITVGPIESSQQPGRGYGTQYSAALLDALVRLGANAISITPFGRIWSLHSTTITMDFEQ